MPVVYIDVLFAVNLVLNCILLRTAGLLVRNRPPLWRTVIGAAVGALYAVAAFFPELSTINGLLFKLPVSMIIVCAAFPIYSVGGFFRLLSVFYASALIFGGLSFAVFFLTDWGARLGAIYSNGIMYLDIPVSALFLGAVAFYGGIRVLTLLLGLSRRRGARRKLIVELDGRRAELTALADTGNILIDPISRVPVVVAELEALKELFDFRARVSLSSENLQDGLSEITALGIKARLIPFSSVGAENGLMVGFVPDLAAVREGSGLRPMGRCIIGIYPKALSADRSYDALYNPNEETGMK